MRYYDDNDLRHYGPLELHSGTDLLAFLDIRYSPKDAMEGCYNTACYVKAVSGEFSGLGDWECDWKDLLRFGEELAELYCFQRNEVEFQDIEWGSELKFTLTKLGHIVISGYLRHYDHTLAFEFRTDQTALKPFLQQMKQLYQPLDKGGTIKED